MPFAARSIVAVMVPVLLLGAIVWATMGSGLPPADFTFCNTTEVKSFDPGNCHRPARGEHT